MPLRADAEVRDKKRAALLSVGSATVLVALKTFLVYRTDSLGVLSEALHSGLDLIAAVITFLSVRVSDQPADERHPYGHGKFENFSAFVETGLLALTALYIIYEGFDRLLFRNVHIRPSVLAFAILGLALLIDVTRSRALVRAASKYSSEALEADALHFSTDVWSTLVVILGIGFVWAGETWDMPWLSRADAVAGLVVAAVILWVGSRLGKRTLDALLDAAPVELQDEITPHFPHGRGPRGRASARSPRRQSVFCGHHGERPAHRGSRTGSFAERRDRTAGRRDRACRRHGARRAARSRRGAPVRDYSRRRPEDGSGHSRFDGIRPGEATFHRLASGGR